MDKDRIAKAAHAHFFGIEAALKAYLGDDLVIVSREITPAALRDGYDAIRQGRGGRVFGPGPGLKEAYAAIVAQLEHKP